MACYVYQTSSCSRRLIVLRPSIESMTEEKATNLGRAGPLDGRPAGSS